MATKPMDEFDFRLKEDKERFALGARQIVARVLHEGYLALETEHERAKKDRKYVTLIASRQDIGKRMQAALASTVEAMTSADKEALPDVQD